MNNQEAIYRLKALLTMCDFRDTFGDRVDSKLYEDAVTMAIEALKTKKPKFTQVAIETDVYWLERQLDMYKEKIYLNEQTMIVYVPFVTAELVEACGGTIQRIGEEECT